MSYYFADKSCVSSAQADRQDSTLKPIILEEIMESDRQKIRDLICCEKHNPQDHAKFYDKYADLVSKQVQLEDADLFLCVSVL